MKQKLILELINHLTNPYSIIQEPEYEPVYIYIHNLLINLCLQELSDDDQNH